MKTIFAAALFVAALWTSHAARAQDANGTLTVNIAQFTSEKELPKKVDKQLRSGGLEWGVKDGLIVFTLVIPVLLWRSLRTHHTEEDQ